IARQTGVLMEVASLTKRYDDQYALANVSFEIRTGEVLGLIGPNGAGKTTLLESVAAVLPVDSEVVLWRGAQLSRSERRLSLFYLPDGVRPWHDQYVLRVIEFFAAIYRRTEKQIIDAVTSVDIAPVLNKRVQALSKGYARRLMWALALLAP